MPVSPVVEEGSPTSSLWLVDALLREQQQLSAVERFSRWHEQAPASRGEHYRELIPVALPRPGEQYAFEVDLDACSGCQACVTACHSLNGLEEKETWRSVGSLHGTSGRDAVLRYVSTACHHCVEPACLQGCPTLAYEKDPATGVVRHLDDQCFGCQYCVLMCPYEAPKYSAAKGIVRKCDMCRQRLAADEPPACVQACPSQAIKIRLVQIEDIRVRSMANDFLPDSPDARLTLPATRFTSREALPAELRAGDHDLHKPAHVPWSLVLMLVLTQMSLGIEATGHVLIAWLGWLPAEPARAVVNLSAAVVGLLGANLAVLHLGRPRIAYRAWLGWRTSWLSREVLAFGVYVPLLMLTAASSFVRQPEMVGRLLPVLEAACIAAGAVAVFCSAMIYVATRRPWWNAQRTFARFAATVFLTGNAACTVIAATTADRSGDLLCDYRFMLLPMAAAAIVVAWRMRADAKFRSSAMTDSDGAIRGTGQLLEDRPLRYIVRRQRSCAVASAFGLPLLAWSLLANCPDNEALRLTVTGICLVRLALTLAAEIGDRYLFFAASVSPRMPGGIAA
jgi:Fe-S-cluster-containing dehydrogenase component/DMSO reductase anchor subunit